MGMLAYAEWLQQAWPSLLALVSAAVVAFAIGLLLRARRAKIQRQYQNRIEQENSEGPGSGDHRETDSTGT